MKKLFTVPCMVVLVSLFTATASFAQVEYNKGDVLLNAGFGLGYAYLSGIPLMASAEFAINDAISIGPYLGFTSSTYRYGGIRRNYTFIDFGARASYHYSKHLRLGTDKLDLYGGLLLGYVVSSYSDNYNYINDSYGSTLRLGLVAGARWYFTDKFGVNGEVGLEGVTPLLLGVTFKL
jgi:hypothetical protein